MDNYNKKQFISYLCGKQKVYANNFNRINFIKNCEYGFEKWIAYCYSVVDQDFIDCVFYIKFDLYSEKINKVFDSSSAFKHYLSVVKENEFLLSKCISFLSSINENNGKFCLLDIFKTFDKISTEAKNLLIKKNFISVDDDYFVTITQEGFEWLEYNESKYFSNKTEQNSFKDEVNNSFEDKNDREKD